MNRIFITGDTHCPIDLPKLNTTNFPEQKALTRDDFVIVLGDFGLYWKDNPTYWHWKNWFHRFKATVCFIDGNHDNHWWLNDMKVSEWHGGKVHQDKNIIHLMRGQVYNIAGKKFFTLGGAASYDKIYRKYGVDWWPEEVPSWNEVSEGIDNLMKHENKVDYILTHTCPYDVITPMFNIVPDGDTSFEKTLQAIGMDLDYKMWMFGHWHADVTYGKFRCFYQDVLEL